MNQLLLSREWQLSQVHAPGSLQIQTKNRLIEFARKKTISSHCTADFSQCIFTLQLQLIINMKCFSDSSSSETSERIQAKDYRKA